MLSEDKISEIITIMVMFHSCGPRCLKHFYLSYICVHCKHFFNLLSYNRFVEVVFGKLVGDKGYISKENAEALSLFEI